MTVNKMLEIAFNHCDAESDDSAQFRATTVEDFGDPVSWNLVANEVHNPEDPNHYKIVNGVVSNGREV